MTEYELGQILSDMYHSAPEGEKVAYVHLFGIKYASELINKNLRKREIINYAGIPITYDVEISNGVKLANYVTINPTI